MHCFLVFYIFEDNPAHARINNNHSRSSQQGGAIMLKQRLKHMITLYSAILFDGWHVENVSERTEGERWETL